MNGEDPRQNERQNLLTRLLDAVKQCQVRFGGRSELATDSDSRVSCLCATWEAVLQHGMKKNNKALSALRHMTEKAGLGKVTDFFTEVKHLDTEPAFWQFVKEHLTKHEIQRFQALKHISSDMGRGRAWLRACLNEHSLERYMHMLIEKEDLISQYYHDWAFMCDQERNSMLPTMSAGLGSILFAITIDRPELNKAYQNTVHVSNSVDTSKTVTDNDEPRAIIAEDTSASAATKKEKKKKKKVANLVSFDEDSNSEVNHGRHSSVTSAGSSSITDDKCSDATPPAPTDDHTSHVTETTETKKELQAETQEEKENGDKDEDKTAAEAPAVEEGRQRTQSQSLEDTVGGAGAGGRAVLQAQCSVASLSSVFSATSMEGATSKSSTGSITSLDNDIGNCILTPVHPDVEHVSSQASSLTVDNTHSDASSDMSVFTRGDVDSAAMALAMAQKGLESVRTDEGVSMEGMPDSMDRYMTHEELRQAVVRMMVKKDDMEAQKRSLQALLEQEMESSSMLRADIADLKQAALQQQELDQARINKLQSENELLKHQLKKYVNAVQLLRTEGASNKDEILGIKLDESQPSIPPAKPAIDYSHEAAEYEQKLIQVAEMHGELMEFNEMLHRQLNAKDAVLRQLRQELVSLRGPLPYNEHQLEESAISLIESVSIQSRTLINIWIPSAFMRGSSSDQYHVYQVYVRIRDEEWNVFRRYSQFLGMHNRLKKVYPSAARFNFPPKKSMGSKDPKVVEGRRHAFQSYLRMVINLLQEKSPELCADTCKARLVALLPFFGDLPEPADKKSKRKRQQQQQQQHQHQQQQQARQSVSAPNASSAAQGAGATGGGTQYQGL